MANEASKGKTRPSSGAQDSLTAQISLWLFHLPNPLPQTSPRRERDVLFRSPQCLPYPMSVPMSLHPSSISGQPWAPTVSWTLLGAGDGDEPSAFLDSVVQSVGGDRASMEAEQISWAP
jgi:hypothetical protein